MKYDNKKETLVPSTNLPYKNFTKEAIQIVLTSRLQSQSAKVLNEQIEEFFNEDYLFLQKIPMTRVVLEIFLTKNKENILIEKWIFTQSTTTKANNSRINISERLRSIYFLTRMSPSFSLYKTANEFNYKLFTNSGKETVFAMKTNETRLGSIDFNTEVIYEYLQSAFLKKIESGDYNYSRPRFYSDVLHSKFQFLIFKYNENYTITDNYYSYNEKIDNNKLKNDFSFTKGASFAYEHIKTEETQENTNDFINTKLSSSEVDAEEEQNKNNCSSDDGSYELEYDNKDNDKNRRKEDDDYNTITLASINEVVNKMNLVKCAMSKNALKINLINMKICYDNSR